MHFQDDVFTDLTKQGSIFQGTTHTNRSLASFKGWQSTRSLILSADQLTRSGLSRIKITCFAQTSDGIDTKAKDSIAVKIFSEC